MARGSFRRNKIQKLQGKGELQSVKTEGPYVEWVGKPEFYRHTVEIEGKPVSEEVQEIGFRFGAVILFSLMSIAIFNDIMRIT